MTRFVLTDAQWALIEPHCLGKSTDPGRTGGGCTAVLRGGAVDRAHRRSVAGPSRGVRQLEHSVQALPSLGQGRCVQTHIRRGVWGPGPRVRNGRRQHRRGPPPRTGCKWGSQRPGHRPLARRLDHQDRRPDRCARQPGGLRTPAGAALRDPGGGAADRRRRVRRADRGQGLRRRLDPCRAGRRGRGGGRLAASTTHPAPAHRPRYLQVAPPHREFLRQTAGAAVGVEDVDVGAVEDQADRRRRGGSAGLRFLRATIWPAGVST